MATPNTHSRKSVAFNTLRESFSPLNKSLNKTPNNLLLNNVNSDESERQKRRSLLQTSVRKSSSINLNESFKLINENAEHHLQICTKLFNENKINANNAWHLRIFDVMKLLADKYDSVDALRIAGPSLDICAKVYSVRVDDVYEKGQQLASNVRRAHFSASNLDENSAVDDDSANDVDGKPKKKKKNWFTANRKVCIEENVSKLLEKSIPTLEPIIFSTKIDPNNSPIENLFTNVLLTDIFQMNFKMPNIDKYSSNEENSFVENDELVDEFPLPALDDLTNLRISHKSFNFVVDEWNPDEEEQLMCEEASISKMPTLNNVVYDDDGNLVPDLDGSLHEEIADNSESDFDVDDETEIKFSDQVNNILDIASTIPSLQYEKSNSFHQLWAGPSHWKLKGIKHRRIHDPTKSNQVKKSRKKKNIEYIDFDNIDVDLNNLQICGKFKKRTLTDESKITLPELDATLKTYIDNNKSLMTMPFVIPMPKENIPENEYEPDIANYDYENLNDSLYCSKNNNSFAIDNNSDDGIATEEIVATQAAQINFTGENLINAPETIKQDNNILCNMRAKKMNMHKLKNYMWKRLSHDGNNKDTDFCKLYEDLSTELPGNMKKELSCGLAFAALLHLCNENNLILVRNNENNRNFYIKNTL